MIPLRRLLILIALLALSTFPHASAQDPPTPDPLTVEAAVRIALEQNSEALLAEEAVEQREALLQQARAGRKPTLNADAAASYTQGLDDPLLDRPVLQRIVPIEEIQPEAEQLLGRLTLEQVLFSGGQVSAAIDAAAALVEAEEWQAEAIRAGIALETKRAYYDVLLARAMEDVAREALETYRRHEQTSTVLYDEGAISRLPLLRAETERSQREADAAQAATAAELALLRLRQVLGIPDDAPLELAGTLEAHVPTPADAEALIAEARASRPELAALDAGHAAAEARVDQREGTYWPEVAGRVEYQSVDGGGRALPDGFRVSIGAQWEIYAGGRRKAAVREAASQARETAIQRAELDRAIALDVRRALAQLSEARTQVTSAEERVGIAAEGLDLAEIRYREGAGTQTDVFDAALAQEQAGAALARARHALHTARAELEKAVGDE